MECLNHVEHLLSPENGHSGRGVLRATDEVGHPVPVGEGEGLVGGATLKVGQGGGELGKALRVGGEIVTIAYSINNRISEGTHNIPLDGVNLHGLLLLDGGEDGGVGLGLDERGGGGGGKLGKRRRHRRMCLIAVTCKVVLRNYGVNVGFLNAYSIGE